MADTHTWSNDIDSSPFNENWHSIKDGLNPEGTQLVYPPTYVIILFDTQPQWFYLNCTPQGYSRTSRKNTFGRRAQTA